METLLLFQALTSLGGNVTATVLNQEYQISLVTGTNTYEITAKDTSIQQLLQTQVILEMEVLEQMRVYLLNSGLDVYVESTGWGVGTWGAGAWGSSTALSDTNQLRFVDT